MPDEALTQHALALLRESDTYREDARQGAPVGNSVIGSLLAIQYQAPRQHTEAATREALRLWDREQESEAEEHVLTRTGQAPLRFRGELLAESDGFRQTGREQTRWHELQVYRTAGGKYVVRISWHTRHQGELGHTEAERVDTSAQVVRVLTAYDPLAHLVGWPSNEAFAEKQARLRADVRSRYENQVSEVLADHPEFAEEWE